MKIVMDEAGRVVARHIDAASITRHHYPDKSVLIGIIDDALWQQDALGNDSVKGSVIDVARDLAKQMVREEVARMTAGLRADYPQEERDTWSSKVAEAQAVLAGGAVEDTIYLAALVAATGGDPATVAKKVIEKATEYAASIALAEAYRSEKYAAIDAARNVGAIISVVDGIG